MSADRGGARTRLAGNNVEGHAYLAAFTAPENRADLLAVLTECEECGGTGANPEPRCGVLIGVDVGTCAFTQGHSGSHLSMREAEYGYKTWTAACPTCGGSGRDDAPLMAALGYEEFMPLVVTVVATGETTDLFGGRPVWARVPSHPEVDTNPSKAGQ